VFLSVQQGCNRPVCTRAARTRLFADAQEEAEAPEAQGETEAPATVDLGIGDMVEELESGNDDAELVAATPPPRARPKRLRRNARPLSDFQEGQTITGTVRTITAYGAFVNFGAVADGLVHISRMSSDFVQDVRSIVNEGDQVEARIVNIDEASSQVGLSFLTAEQAEKQQQQKRGRGQQQGRTRRELMREAAEDDESKDPLVEELIQGGFYPFLFVSGTVKNVVSFGAFVEVDAEDLSGEAVEGTLQGLLHVSQFSSEERVENPEDFVKVGDEVQVRVKSLASGKLELTMIPATDEEIATFDQEQQAKERASMGFSPEDYPDDPSEENLKVLAKLKAETIAYRKKKIIQQILKWEEEGHDWKTKEVGNIKFAIDESFLESVDQARIERQEYLKRISPDKWSRRTIRKLKRAKMERLLRDKADREGLPYSTVLERSGFYEYLHEPEE